MSILSDNDYRYFQTSNFYAAAFLFAKNQTLVNIDKLADPKRAQFVFLNTPELETLLHNYNFAQEGSPETLIDFRKAVTAIKTLKDKLYQGF